MRLEYKYLVCNESLAQLRADLLPFMEIDKHAQDRRDNEYTVRSLYFDTINLDAYDEKIEGFWARKKLRVRGYNHENADSLVFLEIKRKYVNTVMKNRAPLIYSDLETLLETGDIGKYVLNSQGDTRVDLEAKRFMYHLKRRSQRATLLVTYEREAFFCRFNHGLRLTFDKNLRSLPLPATSDLFRERSLEHTRPNHFILEIKFASGFPRWLQDVIERHNLHRSALSKYTMCLDTHRTQRTARKNWILQTSFY